MISSRGRGSRNGSSCSTAAGTRSGHSTSIRRSSRSPGSCGNSSARDPVKLDLRSLDWNNRLRNTGRKGRIEGKEGVEVDRESMMRIEEYRRTEAGPLEGTLIDEFVDGEMDRSTFIRCGSGLGLSMTTIGAALKVFGHEPAAQVVAGAPGVGGVDR